MGAVTPLGNSLSDSWAALKTGTIGINPIDIKGCRWGHAASLKGFDPLGYISPKETRRLDPFVHYAIAAATQAAEDARLSHEHLSASHIFIGSARGGIRTLEAAITGRPGAFTMSASTSGMAASSIAIFLGIHGLSLGISNACASGLYAIGEAALAIKYGRCVMAIAGGAEAPICRTSLEGYGRAGALSKSGSVRPFERDRDGFVLSEGAAVLVLENYGHAKARGARIYGEVLGYGASSDAIHETAPSAHGQAIAIRTAMTDAGLRPDQTEMIFAHATGTRLGDSSEAQALIEVFAGKLPPVCAIKSMTGHMLGASGAFEAQIALLSLGEGIVPPTPTVLSPEFPAIPCASSARHLNGRTAICCSYGFGGMNAAVIFRV